MKQNISVDQYNELSNTQKENLKRWWIPSKYGHPESAKDHPYLNIGELIDFLYQKETVTIESEERNSPYMGWEVGRIGRINSRLELVDALWERVKDYLK